MVVVWPEGLLTVIVVCAAVGEAVLALVVVDGRPLAGAEAGERVGERERRGGCCCEEEGDKLTEAERGLDDRPLEGTAAAEDDDDDDGEVGVVLLFVCEVKLLDRTSVPLLLAVFSLAL